MLKPAELHLTQKWDKTFPKSDKVDHKKVTFINRYGITLAADQYTPKNASGKLAAIALCGPFGAVKEQCSGLYAQTLAERGFLTIAFDPSFTGESGGEPRYTASPDINTEDFQAAVDFLSVQDNVDPERIGILGICGWGGQALNTAAIDTRVKAQRRPHRHLPQRRLWPGGWLSAPACAGGRPLFREGLQRVLQGPGLPRPLPELQRGLEHHRHHVLPEPAHPPVHQ